MIYEKKLLELTKWTTNLERPLLIPELIVIHWIGPYPTQSVYDVRHWWEIDLNYHSAHYIVKGEKILQTMEENQAAYHAGDSRNYRAIGIEVIPATQGGDFAEDTIATLVELCAGIRERWSIKDIVRHYDGVQKKDCPRWYCPQTKGDGRWMDLKARLIA
ncbi:amidase [Spirochaetia bacterium]|nr:amidase [Spirochaetia bacterium]